MSVNNSVFLIGKLGKDPELKFLPGSGIAVATFNLAVDSNFKDEKGNKKTEWISVVCWRKLAELVANNLGKGRLVAVSGSIQTRNYQAQDGHKVRITEVVADEVKFLDWPKDTVNLLDKDGGLKNEFFEVDNSEDIPF